MAQIEIKLTVDSDNANELQAVKVLLNVLGREEEAKPVAGAKKTPTEEPKKTAKEMMEEYEAEETPTEKAKRLKAEKDKARRDKKKAEEAKEEEGEDEGEDSGGEEAEEAEEEDGEEITLSALQSLLAKKVSENKDAIKKKLEKLGAARLTDLKKSKYEVMYEFLSDLD